jgi:exodeoxyribonuclease VII large subunit
VASPHSAAVTDFVKVLASRRTGVEIFLLPIKTQGLGAEAVILEQLAKVNDLCEQLAIDTVVITRGGGSQDDLFVFNSEAVVRAIYGIAKPTIVAIGHERDTTLSELVADLRCSTPSQAAEKVSLSNSEISWQAKSSLELIYRLNQQKVQQYYKYTWLVSATISQLVRTKVQTFKLVCQRTNQLASSLLNAVKRQVETSFYASQRSLSLRLQQIRGQAQQATQVIHSQVTSLLAAHRARLELLITKIELANPKTILAQGYALVWQNQVVQERVSTIDKHLPITIEMQDGSISARIWPQ